MAKQVFFDIVRSAEDEVAAIELRENATPPFHLIAQGQSFSGCRLYSYENGDQSLDKRYTSGSDAIRYLVWERET